MRNPRLHIAYPACHARRPSHGASALRATPWPRRPSGCHRSGEHACADNSLGGAGRQEHLACEPCSAGCLPRRQTRARARRIRASWHRARSLRRPALTVFESHCAAAPTPPCPPQQAALHGDRPSAPALTVLHACKRAAGPGRGARRSALRWPRRAIEARAAETHSRLHGDAAPARMTIVGSRGVRRVGRLLPLAPPVRDAAACPTPRHRDAETRCTSTGGRECASSSA